MGMMDALTPERRRFLKFGLVGASGVAVNAAFLWLGLRLFPAVSENPETIKVLAAALGIAVSIVTNFFINDRWTWGDRKKGARRRDLFARLGTYTVMNGFAAGLQLAITTFVAVTLGWNIYLGMVIGIGVGMIINYIANNRWSFRDQDAG